MSHGSKFQNDIKGKNGYFNPCGKYQLGYSYALSVSTRAHLFHWLNQDLSYDESLSGQPGAWLVKKYSLYACNHKTSKKAQCYNSIYVPE